MQMNPQSFLSGTQYPSVTLGSVHMYATPTTQYMPAQTTHYNANSHHHQVCLNYRLILIIISYPLIITIFSTGNPRFTSSTTSSSKCTKSVCEFPTSLSLTSNWATGSTRTDTCLCSSQLRIWARANECHGFANEPCTTTSSNYNDPAAIPPRTAHAATNTFKHSKVYKELNLNQRIRLNVYQCFRPATSGTESGGGTPTSVNPANPLNLSNEELKQSLTRQLEYYFSRENLARDAYLVSRSIFL